MSKWWKSLFGGGKSGRSEERPDDWEETTEREEEWEEELQNKPTMDGLKQILEEINQETVTEVIRIKVKPFVQGLPTESNFGGVPYIPHGGTIPTTKDGRQLMFLAQINCAELPANNLYPAKGILQFWGFNDDLFGADLDNGLADETKRVLYYPVIEDYLPEEEVRRIYDPQGDMDELYSPMKKGMPFGLTFTLEEEGVAAGDYRFGPLFLEKWNRKYPAFQANSIFDDVIPDEFGDYIYDENFSSGHKIGGYPFFTQTDPREYGNKEYTTLLLQIDSDFNKEYEIMWGDVGVANFFATPRQLKMLDFSGVLYTWDCG